MSTDVGISTGAVLRPAWRRVRFWVGVAVLLVIGAVVFSMIKGTSTGALDPTSASRSGSKAVATLLEKYGTPVSRTTSLSSAAATPAGSTVVVAFPDTYSTSQLSRLAQTSARVVLVAPGRSALSAVGSDLRDSGPLRGPTSPDCPAPGATATGTVSFPDGTVTYDSATLPAADRCYGGAVTFGSKLAVLGSADLLHNRRLADEGVAALDVNLLSADRTTDRVVWLMPGSDATNTAAPTYWDLFPAGAHRAFFWLLALGVLIVLWQARRFGPVVAEPLPVVVRSAEVVEGHGRLYRRAGARDRAAAALRAGALNRLATHAGLQRGAGVVEVAAAVAPTTGRRFEDVANLLGGPIPADDAGLVRLADQLDALEAAAGVPPRPKGSNS